MLAPSGALVPETAFEVFEELDLLEDPPPPPPEPLATADEAFELVFEF